MLAELNPEVGGWVGAACVPPMCYQQRKTLDSIATCLTPTADWCMQAALPDEPLTLVYLNLSMPITTCLT